MTHYCYESFQDRARQRMRNRRQRFTPDLFRLAVYVEAFRGARWQFDTWLN